MKYRAGSGKKYVTRWIETGELPTNLSKESRKVQSAPLWKHRQSTILPIPMENTKAKEHKIFIRTQKPGKRITIGLCSFTASSKSSLNWHEFYFMHTWLMLEVSLLHTKQWSWSILNPALKYPLIFLPELGEGGATVEAQSADQGLESGDSQTIVSWKLFQSTRLLIFICSSWNLFKIHVTRCMCTLFPLLDLYPCLGTTQTDKWT